MNDYFIVIYLFLAFGELQRECPSSLRKQAIQGHHRTLMSSSHEKDVQLVTASFIIAMGNSAAGHVVSR